MFGGMRPGSRFVFFDCSDDALLVDKSPRIPHHAGVQTSALRAALAVALAITACSAAHALPLGIRAKTRITLEHRKAGDALELRGRIVDDRGEPVAHQAVTLDIAGAPSALPTSRQSDADGRFAFTLDARALDAIADAHGTRVPWTIRYDGDRRFGSIATNGVIDLSKTGTRLALTLSRNRLARGERAVEATVVLQTNEAAPRPVGPIDVRLAVGDGAELTGRTGANGRATFVIESQVLTRAGRYRIAARFLGDRRFAASLAEGEIEVLLPTRLTLRVAREGDLKRGRFRFSGRLADEDGPVAGAVVAVRGVLAPPPTPSAFSTLAVTDADGVWVAALPTQVLQDLDRPSVEVTAHYAPSDGVHEPARSLPVLLEIPPVPGVPLSWYAAAFGVALGAAGLGRLLRADTRARAARLWAWLRARLTRTPKAAPGAPEADPSFVTTMGAAGQRARRTDVIAGRVVDAHGRHAVPYARVRVGALEAVADPAGHFTLGTPTAPLPAGQSRLSVDAPGYLPRDVALSLPHRGEYDGIELAVVAVRRRVREVFAEALLRFQAHLRWGHDTPREAARHVRVAGPGDEDPIADLTVLVERAHFGRLPATPDDLAEARRWRDALPAAPAPPAAAPAPAQSGTLS